MTRTIVILSAKVDRRARIKQESKRQRTASESMTSATRTASLDDDSDDDTSPANKTKKARLEANQTAKQAELRESENQRDKARAEAAGRRQERAGRRRADGRPVKISHRRSLLTHPTEADVSDDTPKPNASARTSPPPSSQPPSPPSFAAPGKLSHKKGAGKKIKKLGNNQYTRVREQSSQPVNSSPHTKKRQLANQGHSSGDEQMANGDAQTSNGASKGSPGGNEVGNGKPGKLTGKGKNKPANGVKQGDELAERTIPNMKRAVDGMLGWIQAQQLDMAGVLTPPGSNPSVPKVNVEDVSGLVGGAVQPPGMAGVEAMDGRPFGELSSMEQADVLTRKLARWKERFAVQV